MDREFDEFVAARWPRLVRAAVLLGCGSHEAEDVTQTALTRRLVSWSRVQRADDRDGQEPPLTRPVEAGGRPGPRRPRGLT